MAANMMDLLSGMALKVSPLGGPSALIEEQQIMLLTQHVRALWHHIERLEKQLGVPPTQPAKPGGKPPASVTVEAPESVTLKCGAASIKLMKNGSIQLRGNDIRLEGSGEIHMVTAGRRHQRQQDQRELGAPRHEIPQARRQRS